MNSNESRDVDMMDFRRLVAELIRLTLAYGDASAAERFMQPDMNWSIPSTLQAATQTHLSGDNAKASTGENKASSKFQDVSRTTPMVTGVRISCGREVTNGRPKYEATEIPADDPIFHRQPTSEISERLGIPLIVYSPPEPPHYYECKDGIYDSTNAEASALHIHCDPNGHFGTFYLGWNGKMGHPR